jgi:hypothetical protein
MKNLKFVKFESLEKFVTCKKNHRFAIELILKYLDEYSLYEELSENDSITWATLTNALEDKEEDYDYEFQFYTEYFFESKKHGDALRHFIDSYLNSFLMKIHTAFDEKDFNTMEAHFN